MTYKVEFPEFDLGGIEIPAGFEDSSWHNDASPCWINVERRMCLWVDWPNAADREHPTMSRFVITRTDEEGQHTDSMFAAFESDNYNELIAWLSDSAKTA